MSWLARLLGRRQPAKVQNATPLPSIVRGTEAWNWFVESGASGLPVPSERSALSLTACYACVNLIAGGIKSVPKDIHSREDDGNLKKIDSDGLWWILNEQFMPRWPAAAGWTYLTASLLLHGDAFAEIRRDPSGAVRGLLPLHPSRILISPSQDGERLVYAVLADIEDSARRQITRVLDQDDMIHVPGFGFDGTRSLSVLRHALSSAAGAGLAMQDFTGRFFVNGARPDYTINSDNAVSDAVVKQLYDTLEQFKGFANAHRPMVLTGGLKISPITMPLAEMQLLESRKFQLEEVARIYGVPPFMIGHTEKSTSWGTGLKEQAIGLVRYSLRPHIVSFENEFSRKLWRTGRRVMRMDTADLERADAKTLMESLRTGVGRAGERPLLSQNDARRVLRLPPVAGGDDMSPLAGNAALPEPEPEPEQ